jgi:hypothetical protein
MNQTIFWAKVAILPKSNEEEGSPEKAIFAAVQLISDNFCDLSQSL